MKRLCLCVLLVFCFLLPGCGSKKEEKLLSEFSSALSQRQDLSFIGKLRAEYSDRTVNFTLQYKQQDEECTVTVLSPEEIEGLSVRLGENGSIIEYDRLFIESGDLDEFGLSPLSALPLLAESLRGSYLDSVRREDNELVFSLIPEDDVVVEVWFDEELMVPTHAELISSGKARVFCDIENWR